MEKNYKTYICKECGKEIDKIEFNNGYLQKFDDCYCSSHKISVPIQHYNTYSDMKCPYCGKYPFKDKPVAEIPRMIVVIDIDDNVDDVL